MARYAAFLRAINVGGRRLTNDELAGCFREIGLGDVATYQAAGNVIFEADGRSTTASLRERIETGLLEALGYEVPTLIRDGDQLAAIVEREPFDPTQIEASRGKPQVMLLGREPAADERSEALELGGEDDLLVIEGSELHWLPAAGIIDSDFDPAAAEKLLGAGTVRTVGTVERIAAKYFSD